MHCGRRRDHQLLKLPSSWRSQLVVGHLLLLALEAAECRRERPFLAHTSRFERTFLARDWRLQAVALRRLELTLGTNKCR